MRLVVLAAAAWQDCSQDEGITNPVLTFANVTSDPEPVLYGDQQYIYKQITNHGPELTNITATLSQYWQVLGHWVRFLKIDINQCPEHPELCPLKEGQQVQVVTKHPPLHWGTPYGLYRSRQVYTDGKGTKIGCVDMQFRYCKDKDHCVAAPNATMAPVEPGAATVEEAPCCEGACAAGEEKYYSVAKSILGTPHCGECCMDPKKYNLYHFFEKNLTKATSDSPCSGFGFTKYDSTVTHGFGPVKMTLDLYDKPSALLAPPPFAPPMPAAYEMLISWSQVHAGKTYAYTHRRSYDVRQQLYRDDQMDGSKIVTSTVYRPTADKKAYQYGPGGCTTWDFESRIDGFPPTAGFAFNRTDAAGNDEFSKTFYDPTGKVALYRLDVKFHGTVPVQYHNTADEGAVVGGVKTISAYAPKIDDPKRFTIPKEWGCKVADVLV